MSVEHLFSPTPLLGLGARSLDDQSLVDLLGLLPQQLLEQVLVVVRTVDSSPSGAVPTRVGPFPLIEAAAIGAGAEIQIPSRAVLHLPAGWMVDHDAQRWWLVAHCQRPGNDGGSSDRVTKIDAAESSLDPFFHEIARVAGRQGIGVLISACVPAGIHGLRSVADAGGLTMVETPCQSKTCAPSAAYGFVDHHDHLAGLARGLQARLGHRQRLPAQAGDLRGQRNDEQTLSRRVEQLERELRKTRADLERKEQELQAATGELKNAHERQRLVLDAVSHGAWDWHILAGRVEFSPQWLEQFGYDTSAGPHDVEFWSSIIHPDDLETNRRAIDAHLDGRSETVAVEKRLRSVTGQYRWYLSRGRIVQRDAEGRPVRMVGVDTNISEQKAVESARRIAEKRTQLDISERRQSEQRLRRLVDTAQVGIAFARADGRIVECNGALLKTLGYDRETFEREGLNWKQANLPIEAMFDPPDGSSSCPSSTDDPGGTAAVGQTEIPLVRRDGSRVETLCSVRQLEEGGDEFVTFVVDLTPLKIAEEQLRRSEDQLRRAAEGAGFGMYEIDLSTGHITWSPEMRKLLGVATDNEVPARGSLIADFIHPEDRQAADAALTESLDPTGSGSLQHEYRIVRPDGSIRWLLVRGSTVFGSPPEKRPLCATGIVLDVTDRKRVEQSLLHARSEAEAASRAKSEFLANMSHEIRTPMTAILGYADLVAEQMSDPMALEQIETIRRNGRFLLNIINDILDLSKIDAGRLEVHRQPCQVGQLITDVCALMEVRVREKDLQLIVDFEGQIPQTINTDPTRLRQVLVNLIGNAIKFTDEGSVEVVVRHEESDQRLQIDVIDTGIGIAEDAQAELFAPFMQVDTAINRQFGGTGLGLAITRRLAEMLGGVVTVTSTLGEGSCFTVSIATGPLEGVPRVSPVLQIPNTPPPERADSRVDSRILVVDDSRDIRSLASTLLKRVGADVTTADGGQEAIDAVASAEAEGRPFELIFMDVQMPGMDGPTAVSRLRASGYTIPVVALTANAMQGDREKCLRQGYTDYLSKPLDIRHFSATLKKYLHH